MLTDAASFVLSKFLVGFVNFHYREGAGVQRATSCLSQQLSIGGDTSQPHKVLNSNKPSETTDACINMKTGTPCQIRKHAVRWPGEE